MKAKVDAIAAHGINCFVNRQLIYNYPESLLAEKGILTIEHADFEGVERLALVTGGEIASTFDHPELVQLGRCELIEEIMIGEDKVRLAQDCLLPGSRVDIRTIAHLRAVDQVLRCCRGRGVHGGPSWVDKSDDRRGRSVTTRCALRPIANCEGDANCAGRWLLGDAHEHRGRGGGEEDPGEEGNRCRGVRAGSPDDPDHPCGQCGI